MPSRHDTQTWDRKRLWSDAVGELMPDGYVSWTCSEMDFDSVGYWNGTDEYEDGTADYHFSTEANYPGPTEAEINARYQTLLADFEAHQYQRERADEYPSVGDQLGALIKGGSELEDMKVKVQAVKDAHPNPAAE